MSRSRGGGKELANLKIRGCYEVNYYPHHIGDYLRDTSHLSILEDGVYRRMLDLYYASEKPLPLDISGIYRLIRAKAKDEKAAVDTILEEFFCRTDGGWRNKRADEEICVAKEKSEKARASAECRWTSERNANAMRTHTEGNAPNNQEPIAKSQSKKLAADAPPNGGSTVWDFGKSLLHEQGLSRQAAGGLISSWLKEWSEPAVADALRSAAGKADVRSYVAAILKTKPKKEQAGVKVDL